MSFEGTNRTQTRSAEQPVGPSTDNPSSQRPVEVLVPGHEGLQSKPLQGVGSRGSRHRVASRAIADQGPQGVGHAFRVVSIHEKASLALDDHLG